MAHLEDQHSLEAKNKQKMIFFLPCAADFYQTSLNMKKVLDARQQAAALSISSAWNQTNGGEPLVSRSRHFTAVTTGRFRRRGSARERNEIKTPCTRTERRGVA